MASVLESIREALKQSGVEYRETHHDPTPTSQDSARIRGIDLGLGGKALILKVGEEFRLFVISAALRLDTKAIEKKFSAKKTRFATPEELLALTGLVPGSVPPFGRPILPMDLFLDESILRNEAIAFNAGSLTDSIDMRVEDYVRVAKPVEIFLFSKPAA